MSLLTLIGTGMAVGFIFAAPPGAVNTEALRRGLRGGFRAALSVELGAVVGDTFWLAVAMVGAAALLEAPGARLVLGFGGAIGMLYLSYRAFRQFWNTPDLSRPYQGTGKGAFATGILISLANPFALAFWLTIGGGLGSAMHALLGRSPAYMAAFVGAFVCGCCTWAVSFSALVAGGRRLLTPNLFRWINLVIASAMLGFSIWLWYSSVLMLYR